MSELVVEEEKENSEIFVARRVEFPKQKKKKSNQSDLKKKKKKIFFSQ